MSLVSGDYDDDDEVPSPPLENKHKRRSVDPGNPLEKKLRPMIIPSHNNNDDLPPLPASFNNATAVPYISVTKSPPPPNYSPRDSDEDMLKRAFLVPPQIWKKQPNITTEDTASWTTERKKPAKKLAATM